MVDREDKTQNRNRSVRGFDDRVLYDHDLDIERTRRYGVFTDVLNSETNLSYAPLTIMGESAPTVSLYNVYHSGSISVSINDVAPITVLSIANLPKGSYLIQGQFNLSVKKAKKEVYLTASKSSDDIYNLNPVDIESTALASAIISPPVKNEKTIMPFIFGFSNKADVSPALTVQLQTEQGDGTVYAVSYVLWRY